MTGKADFYADGQWNFYCDLCGAKTKSSDAMKTWDNFMVCKHHKEARNPQDFIRGIKDRMSVPWTRPTAEDGDANPHCTTAGRNAIPGLGVAGCMVAGLVIPI